MNIRKLRIKSWLWLGYPVLVALFIALSSNALLSNQDQLGKMMERKDSLAEQEAKAGMMRQKIAILEKVDLARESESLKEMVRAVPASKTVWALVSELKLSASESGAILESYKGTVGNVKEATEEAQPETGVVDSQMELDVTFQVADFEILKNLLNSLEQRVPIIKINRMKYSLDRVEMRIEGAWKSWERVAGSEDPIPDYMAGLSEVKKEIDSYKRFEEIDLSGLSDDTGTVNPF